ncbi:MAG: transcription antitermination factor NusB [Saprospiraceae bacterium]|nr:transcription antitermination factor NusB [Saprospiraceae bacterium]
MLSRRNIRIKVMQVLYALNRNPELTLQEGEKRYLTAIQKSFELFLFNLVYLQKIAAYSLKEYETRQAKLLPSEEDKSFKPILWDNPLIESIRTNPEFEKRCKKAGLFGKVDADNVRIFYTEFAKSDVYQNYLSKAKPTLEDHRKVLLEMYRTSVKNENFADLMEEHFSTWMDDESLIVGSVKKLIKSLPVEGRFFDEFEPEREATQEFGLELLRATYRDDEELLEEIKPTLQNWDVDRVAILDLIMLKMAVCELSQFPSIPTKVTLNEFVEIAKSYSTDKSKDFINGILDRLMKQLSKAGKIVKEGRGLIE